MKYLYIQDNPPTIAAPNPHMDTNPATVTNITVPSGIHIGLEMMMIGVKKINVKTVAVMVIPVRRRRMPPETRRVNNPMSWVELGTWPWSLLKNVEVGLVWDRVWVDLCWFWFWFWAWVCW